METESRTEQHYAVSKNGMLVHISEAHRDKDYFCPHCGCRMIQKCGKIRVWHFAHDYRYENEVIKRCSPESYLHAYAKLRIKQWFEETPSIKLRYRREHFCNLSETCIWLGKKHKKCREYRFEECDLKDFVTRCEVEKTVNIDGTEFRADLLLSCPSKPENNIFVEIKVTHGCTEEKRNSKARIIEFEISSEDDVDNIINNTIEEGEKVHFYGFSPKPAMDGNVDALFKLVKFIYYNTGKAFSHSVCTCQNYQKIKRNSLIEITAIESTDGAILDKSPNDNNYYTCITDAKWFVWGLAFAKSKQIDVRNCSVCKHYIYDPDQEDYDCDFDLKYGSNSEKAIDCESYCINDELIEKRLAEFQEYQKNNAIGIFINKNT